MELKNYINFKFIVYNHNICINYFVSFFYNINLLLFRNNNL